jgi:hypothetical protein
LQYSSRLFDRIATCLTSRGDGFSFPAAANAPPERSGELPEAQEQLRIFDSDIENGVADLWASDSRFHTGVTEFDISDSSDHAVAAVTGRSCHGGRVLCRRLRFEPAPIHGLRIRDDATMTAISDTRRKRCNGQRRCRNHGVAD